MLRVRRGTMFAVALSGSNTTTAAPQALDTSLFRAQ
jgi:hypothetical protein